MRFRDDCCRDSMQEKGPLRLQVFSTIVPGITRIQSIHQPLITTATMFAILLHDFNHENIHRSSMKTMRKTIDLITLSPWLQVDDVVAVVRDGRFVAVRLVVCDVSQPGSSHCARRHDGHNVAPITMLKHGEYRCLRCQSSSS